MRLLTFEQGSKDWLEWREGGIGGSDAASIMGVSPYQTRAELLAHKRSHRGGHVRLSSKGKTPAMLRGTRLEPIARGIYQEQTGHLVSPACCIHERHSWMRASLDGLTEDGLIALEIKCPNKDDHSMALAKTVPAHYWPQVQHILAVTGCPRLHYFSYSESKLFPEKDLTALVQVRPDPAYIDKLIEAEEKFWEEVGKKI